MVIFVLSKIVIIRILQNCFILYYRNAEYSASLLQSSVSHDITEIILKCWCGS